MLVPIPLVPFDFIGLQYNSGRLKWVASHCGNPDLRTVFTQDLKFDPPSVAPQDEEALTDVLDIELQCHHLTRKDVGRDYQ